MADNTLYIKIKTELNEFRTGMQRIEKDLKVFAKKTERIGKELSTALTLPIAGMGVLAVKNFAEQEKALAGLQAQLRSSGKDVETLTTKYTTFASEMQKITVVGDETTLKLLQLAESMNSINPEEAVRGAIALNQALGIDFEQAVKMAVNAQNGNFTMLQRMIPALREAKNETEKAAIMQKLYSDGMAIAQEQAQRGLGPLQQLKNQIGDLSENFGAIIVKMLTPLVAILKKIGEYFAGLSPRMQDIIVKVALLLAAIGPLFLIISKTVGVFLMMKNVFVMLTSPIGLVIASVMALAAAAVTVIRNWDKISDFFKRLWLNIQKIFYSAIYNILAGVQEFTEKFGIKFGSVEKLKTKIETIDKKIADLKKTTKETTAVVETHEQKVGKLATTYNDLSESVGEAKKKIVDVGTAYDWDKILQESRMSRPEDREKYLIKNTAVGNVMSNALTSIPQSIKKTTQEVKTLTIELQDTLRQGLESVTQTAAEQMGLLIANLIMPGQEKIQVGKNILLALANFGKQFGSLLMATGFASLQFQASLMANPVAAIAAGAALVALSTAAGALLNQTKQGLGAFSGSGKAGGGGGMQPAGVTSATIPQKIEVFGFMAGSGIYFTNEKTGNSMRRVR